MIYELYFKKYDEFGFYKRETIFTTKQRLIAFAKAYIYGFSIWWKQENNDSEGWLDLDRIIYVPFAGGTEFTIPYHKNNDDHLLAINQRILLEKKEYKLKNSMPKRDWFWQMKGVDIPEPTIIRVEKYIMKGYENI